jgi:hypothetical protein
VEAWQNSYYLLVGVCLLEGQIVDSGTEGLSFKELLRDIAVPK